MTSNPMDELVVELSDIQSNARNQFVFFLPPEFDAALDEAMPQLDAVLRDLVKTFQHNIQSAVEIASLPFIMVTNEVRNRRFQSLHSAARVRQLKGHPAGTGLSEAQEHEAYKLAREQMQSHFEGRDHIMQVLNDLGLTLRDENARRVNDELLRQTAAMVWAGFESFSSDYLRYAFNSDPTLADKAMKSEQTRKHYPQNTVTEALSHHSFNVANKLGDILLSAQNTVSLPMLKDSLALASNGDKDLMKALNSDVLWKLWQRRHLIVHRRGVVDAAYVAKSGDKLVVGSHLTVKPSDIDEYSLATRDVVVALVKCRHLA